MTELKNPSTAEENSPSTKSIYDFVYLDGRRLSHFFEQLSDLGLIVNSKHSFKTSATSSTDVTGHIGVPSIASTSGKNTNTSFSEDGSEHTVDSSYSRPLETLSKLDEDGYIVRDINDVFIGSLFLGCGKLRVMDYTLLSKSWDAMSRLALEEAKKPLLASQTKSNKYLIDKAIAETKRELDSPKDVLSIIPDITQAELFGDDYQFWFTLDRSNLFINYTDLSLKNAGRMSGEWYVLGIVDTIPNEDEEPIEALDNTNDKLIEVMGAIRELCGRPDTSYSLTPIMIFRKIRACR